MKRRINNRLLLLALALVVLICEFFIIGATGGSFYIRTQGTSSDNIRNLMTSVVSGDGDACTLYTDSYKKIDFDASGANEPVASICDALVHSYTFAPKPDNPDAMNALSAVQNVDFSYLDLNKLEETVADVFDDNVFQIVQEYDTNVTTPEGKYIPEIYEQAYTKSVLEALQEPETYYSSETLELKSSYNIENGIWNTRISNRLAGALQGGYTGGILSDTLSIPNAAKEFVDSSIASLTGETAQVRNQYSLPYSATVGPRPDQSKYFRFTPDKADQVLNLIAYARSSGLLGDQDVIFNPEASFYPDEIICYCDDSILVICWKEYINGSVCNCMEVKLADGSQIKRKLTGDTYNSGILDTMTNMYAATNAVAAMSGDYYAYRFFGLTVYQSQLYRYDMTCEVLMIDDQGRFIFYYPDGRSADEMQAFVDANNVQFSLAFGPVLVDNYTPRYYTNIYALGLGQMLERYTRAAFGEFDDLHYLFMTSGYAVGAVPPADLNAFIDILLTKNLKNVYNMDGGQTAEIVILNQPYNQIDFRAERTMSDMVFFATAVPENQDD